MVAKYYFDARLEREKAQLTDLINKSVEPLRASLQQETNRLSAEQTRVTDRLQTMFSTLQTERAQAIKELYAKIVKVESLLNFITVAKTITAESAEDYQEAVSALIDYYLPNRIWLPSAVSDQVNELRSTFFAMQKTINSADRNVRISKEFHQGLVAAKSTTARTLEEVSDSFRALLGAEIV